MLKCGKCKELKEISCFHKDSNNPRGRNGFCKECRKQYKYDQKEYEAAKEHCTYIAEYPHGIYVGSGKLLNRRKVHLAGSSKITALKGHRAVRFIVLATGSKESCKKFESQVIGIKGLDNLLNTYS